MMSSFIDCLSDIFVVVYPKTTITIAAAAVVIRNQKIYVQANLLQVRYDLMNMLDEIIEIKGVYPTFLKQYINMVFNANRRMLDYNSTRFILLIFRDLRLKIHC